jgi:hypothetical protein
MTCNDGGSGAQAALLWDCDDDCSFDENIQFSNHGNNGALHQSNTLISRYVTVVGVVRTYVGTSMHNT